MALRDWNNDGRNDFTDNFIEHEIYKNAIDYFDKKDKEYVNNSKKSEPPTWESVKGLLRVAAFVWSVAAFVWSLVLIMYLIDKLIVAI